MDLCQLPPHQPLDVGKGGEVIGEFVSLTAISNLAFIATNKTNEFDWDDKQDAATLNKRKAINVSCRFEEDCLRNFHRKCCEGGKLVRRMGIDASNTRETDIFAATAKSPILPTISKKKKWFSENADDISTNTRIIPLSLPMLLHLRQVGLSHSATLKKYSSSRHRKELWLSLMLQRPMYSSSESKRMCGLPKMPKNLHSASLSSYLQKLAHWDCLQFSSPTYYCSDSHGNTTRGISNLHAAKPNSKSISISKSCINLKLHRKEWRPYTRQQRIPFSKLKTPMRDAILAMDRFGSYLIGIGTNESGNIKTNQFLSDVSISQPIVARIPRLSLKFYGEIGS